MSEHIVLKFNEEGGSFFYNDEFYKFVSSMVKNIYRITDIDFDPEHKEWVVYLLPERKPLFSHPSRNACVQWEKDNAKYLLTIQHTGA